MPGLQDPLFAPTDYFRELSLGEVFDSAHPTLELDLGCGDGGFLLGMAGLHPERRFLGLERLAGRVLKTAKRLRQAGVTNARVLRIETVYALGWLIPEAAVTRLHLLCPDPWPKKKHGQRRLFNDEAFLSGVGRVLRPGGEFLLKTDDGPYYDNALEVMAGRPEFRRMDWPEGAFPYARTDFEQQWVALGKKMRRARWLRV